MFKVTADVFSGCANPAWYLEGQTAVEFRRHLELNRGAIGHPGKGFSGLGFRGLIVEQLSDHLIESIPTSFRLADGSSLFEQKSIELAEGLVAHVARSRSAAAPHAEKIALDARLQKFLSAQLLWQRPSAVAQRIFEGQPVRPETVCYYEISRFNPGFWNDNAYVTENNNCYNYGRNWRTDTFAQPGRASGHIYDSISCPDVSAAALRDGAHNRYDCFPDNEYPRWLMALVVAPDWPDFHWYRKHLEGFWGHKPGGTQARNYDNSGNIISDPETADRGPYTQFCGYFYAEKDMVIS